MKKLIKLLNNNKKFILGIIVGLVIAGSIGVYAATVIAGNSVSYSNSKSGLSATNIQDAIDEVFNNISSVDSDSIDFATLKTNTAKTVLASSKGVCINRNGKLNCFKRNNWAEEQNHIQQVFSDISCYVGSSYVRCYASDFHCNVNSNGDVYCSDYSADSICYVYSSGTVRCD